MVTTAWLVLIGGLLLAASLGASCMVKGSRRWLAAGSLLLVLSLALTASGTYGLWLRYRPQPAPLTERALFAGVTYDREVLSLPRPIVAHVVAVDLDADGISLVFTRPREGAGRRLVGRTTSAFARERGVQLAINGAFFFPWHVNSPWDYYPKVGDPVDVLGPAAAEGAVYTCCRETMPVLHVDAGGRAKIGPAPDVPYNALAGGPQLLDGGRLTDENRWYKQPGEPHPRSAVALDESQRKLLLFVVDGRQPGYSEGMTLGELAELIRRYGGHDALNLDGGGSSVLVVAGADGRVGPVSSPIHNRLRPGNERPVASHIGIRATRVDAASGSRAGHTGGAVVPRAVRTGGAPGNRFAHRRTFFPVGRCGDTPGGL